MFTDLDAFFAWFRDRALANDYRVTPRPLEKLDGWYVDGRTGDVAHRSGRFFSVRGLKVTTDHRADTSWSQPIILQPEIGVLGIIVRMVDGVPHFLMQAKMEPGNINSLQLSPTVQATRSNYTRVHQGGSVPYLEHFVNPENAVFDALQSEQGSWFFDKRNRNMIVQVDEDLPLLDDFCWLSLDQLNALMQVPNLLNMDSRTVLAGVPFFHDPAGRRSGAGLHTTERLLSWFTDMKARHELDRTVVPLSHVSGWHLIDGRIEHLSGKYFSVMGVDVQATNREVARWSQPMLQPVDRGIVAFLGRYVDGVFHVLVHARTEAGTHDVVEIAPTVSCNPANYADLPADRHPRFLDVVRNATPDRMLFDVVHSEEGGRFYHAENRYQVIDVGEDFDLDVPGDYCWTTVDQLTAFVRYGNYVNVSARCLMSCLNGVQADRPVADRWAAAA